MTTYKESPEEEEANFHPAADALETALQAEYWSTDYTRLVLSAPLPACCRGPALRYPSQTPSCFLF